MEPRQLFQIIPTVIHLRTHSVCSTPLRITAKMRWTQAFIWLLMRNRERLSQHSASCRTEPLHRGRSGGGGAGRTKPGEMKGGGLRLMSLEGKREESKSRDLWCFHVSKHDAAKLIFEMFYLRLCDIKLTNDWWYNRIKPLYSIFLLLFGLEQYPTAFFICPKKVRNQPSLLFLHHKQWHALLPLQRIQIYMKQPSNNRTAQWIQTECRGVSSSAARL